MLDATLKTQLKAYLERVQKSISCPCASALKTSR